MKNNKDLKRAIDFHGHLGPYLVLGLLMGELAIKKLKCRRHFGLNATVKGAAERPKSCLIDGLQLSTGCTYGKGNISKLKANKIQAIFKNIDNNKRLVLSLQKDLINRLSSLKGHRDSEIFARKLLKIKPLNLFDLK